MIFILSGHRHDNEPYITEEIFFSSMWYYEHFTLEFMLMEKLKEHEVLDESSFKMVAFLPQSEVIDRLHYVMYRIARKENGLQILYQCLKETQDRAPDHRDAVEILKEEGEFRAWNKERFSYFVIYVHLAFSSITYIYIYVEKYTVNFPLRNVLITDKATFTTVIIECIPQLYTLQHTGTLWAICT